MKEIDHGLFRRLDLNLLVAFDALVTETSVTRAAARLHVGQPAMSNALARLRTLLDDEILYREGASMALTERARVLAPRVRQLLIEAQAVAFEPPAFDPAKLNEQFRLSLTDPLEALLLPPLLARLRMIAPGLALSVSPIPAWQQLEHLDQGSVHIVVGYFPQILANHVQARLYDARFFCAFNPALVTLPDPATLSDLAQLPHIHTSYTGDGPGMIDQAFQRRRLKRQIVAHAASPLSIPFVVKQSPIVAVLPDIVTRLFEHHTELRIQPLPVEDLCLPITTVVHRRDKSSALVNFILDELKAAARVVFVPQPA